MMKSYHLTISTPSGNAFDGDAVNLTVKGSEGELGILADHIPLVTTVLNGKCNITVSDGSMIEGKISGGLLTVTGEKVTLLVSSYKR